MESEGKVTTEVETVGNDQVDLKDQVVKEEEQPTINANINALSESVKIVFPFIHEKSQTACDFCDAPRSQKYKFDITSAVPRELRVCASAKCDTNFVKSKIEFYTKEKRVPFEALQDALPGLLDPKRSWKVMRGNGVLEDGWRIARNWRVSCEMSSLSTLRGEPWWRIPLQNNDKVRLTLLHELREYNKDAFAEDVWDMLLNDLLPSAADDPTEEFLEYYPAKVWKLQNPLEANLLELRI